MKNLLIAAFAVSFVAAPTLAFAQIEEPKKAVGGGDLPPPQDDNDPVPPAARNAADTPGVTEQAGIGGTQAYGRAGVLELGGAIGFTAAEESLVVRATPSIGWFLVDNFQLSVLVSANYASINDLGSMTVGAVFEPSYHLPLSDTTFLFGGVGAGFSYTGGDQYVEDPGAGFLLSPRLGFNLLVGRSGILSPYFHFDYSTVDAVETRSGTVLALDTSYGMNIGYTVMW